MNRNLGLYSRNGHKCKDENPTKSYICLKEKHVLKNLRSFSVLLIVLLQCHSLTPTQASGETGLSSIFTHSPQTHNMLTQTHRPSRLSPQSTNVITSAYLHVNTVIEAFDLFGLTSQSPHDFCFFFFISMCFVCFFTGCCSSMKASEEPVWPAGTHNRSKRLSSGFCHNSDTLIYTHLTENERTGRHEATRILILCLLQPPHAGLSWVT